MLTLRIKPTPKPRMTQRDKWKQRKCVVNYYKFKDAVNQHNLDDFRGDSLRVIFFIKMPKSWSNKKRNDLDGTAHQSKPDIDNLTKALLDAMHGEDCHVYDL